MYWILDLMKAIQRGYNVPTAGVFRGERAEIIRQDGKFATIKLPETPHKDETFVVGMEVLIPKED